MPNPVLDRRLQRMASDLEEIRRKRAGDVVQMSLAMAKQKAQSVGRRYQDNDPGEKLAKDVYALSVAAAQVATNYNLIETGARFGKAANLALRTRGTPMEASPRASTHAGNLVNGAALLIRGAQSERLKTIQEGLYRIGSSLSDLMMHYGNSAAESMYDAAHQAASRGN